MIYWTQFDWQSFATLVTGLAAVIAATVIGKRQTAISDRQTRIAENQTEILRQQVRLAELTLRNDLFDRRAEIYEATRGFLGYIIRRATYPDAETRNAFLTAINASKLLFRPSVSNELTQIWKLASEYDGLKAEMASIYARDGHYGDGNPDKELAYLAQFEGDLKGLIDLFGDELKLSAH